MVRKDFKERCRLIVERIKQCPCRFDDIKTYLLKSNEFQRIEMKHYSIRSLQRDIKYIEEVFDVFIKNKRGRDARYYILNETPEYI
ncbi:hypothetical protein HZQ12_10330 [Elizabethkingia anophelis]|uniref:hypothetical protein n=1 Tax=Elizabethkingia anophelis TaxID=1117645 RepID=UPI0021A90E00|nr:hypothetical protein [Elizabethkingia anophelis]MCT3977299.1 hypothetical protein [Elizabethkingia anophelis]MCT4040823.1 hypothetical protein [Elizabethkingia anophelis]